MSWNGSGVFNRLFSWQADAAAGIDITASRMDSDTNNITSNGFGNTLTRDGQGSATANQPMNGFRHTNVQNGQAATDYLALGQYQLGEAINWSTDSGAADAIAVTYTPAMASLTDGQLCFVRAANANATTTPTFAPNGLTAHTITKLGGVALSAGDIQANQELALRYNLSNTRWELANPRSSLNPQAQTTNWVAAGGTADAIMATYSPAVTALYDGLLCFFRATASNATTTPTFAPNGLTAHTITKKGGAPLSVGDIPANLAETILRYNLASTRWELLNPSTQLMGMNSPLNLQINATVGSNLLTVALKDANGNDPSAASPVPMVFRDPTITSGAPILRQVTGALSISTFATGATLGTQSSSVPFRLWVVAFDNAGTVVLALWHSGAGAAAPAINPLNEGNVQTSVAISGGATSSGVFYTPNGTTVTAKSIRILGYLEYSAGLVTAGTYNIAPTEIQLFGPGIKKPGDVVQSLYFTSSTQSSVSSSTYTSTNLTLNITPTSAANLVSARVSTPALNNNYGVTTARYSLFRGSTQIGSEGVFVLNGVASSATVQFPLSLAAFDNPQTASSTTYVVKITSSDNSTAVAINSGNRQGIMVLDEIMG